MAQGRSEARRTGRKWDTTDGQSHYGPIRYDVVDSGRLALCSKQELLVYAVLCRHCNRKTWFSRPGVSRIAKVMGMKPRRVQIALRSLVERGLIRKATVGGGRGRATVYQVRGVSWFDVEIGETAPRESALSHETAPSDAANSALQHPETAPRESAPTRGTGVNSARAPESTAATVAPDHRGGLTGGPPGPPCLPPKGLKGQLRAVRRQLTEAEDYLRKLERRSYDPNSDRLDELRRGVEELRAERARLEILRRAEAEASAGVGVELVDQT